MTVRVVSTWINSAGAPLTPGSVSPFATPTIAISRSDDGSDVTGSPITMTHIANGQWLFEFEPDPMLHYAVLSDGDPNATGQVDANDRYQQTAFAGSDPSQVLDEFVVAGGSTAGEVRTNATEADGFFDDAQIIVISVSPGSPALEVRAVRDVNAYLNTNGAFTPDEPLPFTPAAGDRCIVVARTASARVPKQLDTET